eukprot:1150654-Pelagomonas_calceolata.AAC.3
MHREHVVHADRAANLCALTGVFSMRSSDSTRRDSSPPETPAPHKSLGAGSSDSKRHDSSPPETPPPYENPLGLKLAAAACALFSAGGSLLASPVKLPRSTTDGNACKPSGGSSRRHHVEVTTATMGKAVDWHQVGMVTTIMGVASGSHYVELIMTVLGVAVGWHSVRVTLANLGVAVGEARGVEQGAGAGAAGALPPLRCCGMAINKSGAPAQPMACCGSTSGSAKDEAGPPRQPSDCCCGNPIGITTEEGGPDPGKMTNEGGAGRRLGATKLMPGSRD